MGTKGFGSHGISILVLDSGGSGTYSQLLILKEYASRLANDLGISEDDLYLADYFDLMGGVGFGGLVVLLIGHLRMNLNEAIDTLLEVASAVFPEGPQQTINRETNTKELKKAVEAILEARGISLDTKMNDPQRPPSKCKVILYAATSARINHPQAFRTYPSRSSSLNPTIVEAICATMAESSHFSPVKFGPRRRQQSFIGGAVGANNPTRELLKEASTVFGNESRVAQIISIGSGIHPVFAMNSDANEANLGRLSKDIAKDCEGVAQELHARLYNINAYLRLNVERGMENITIDDWNELGAIESHTGAYITMASVSKSIDTSLRHLRDRVGTVTLGQLNQSSSIKVTAKTAPAVSPHFVPRTGPWTKMVHHLVSPGTSRQKIFPITGMGGCGKTQMVSYFLQENPSLYTHVAIVNASSVYSAQSDLEAWAQAFGDGHERDVWEDGIRLLSNVPLNERWLLVLDNADDPKLNLAPFIPKNPNLTIIITSRNRDLRNLSTTYHLELGEMEADEALSVLLRAAQRELPLPAEEMKAAQTLIKELGYLAVALVQAGTYCHRLSSDNHGIFHPYTFTKYLALFATHRAELMKKAQPSPLDNYERGVYTTLDLSYQAIPQRARELLHFLSFFHHTDIPVAALATAAASNFADIFSTLPRPDEHGRVVADLERLLCAEKRWNELLVEEAIQNLRSFSLISTTSTGDSLFLQIHPLIQAWSRDTILSTSRQYKVMVMQVLTSCDGSEDPQLHRQILPHILDILGQVEIKDIHVNDLMAIGEVLRDQGHYRRAIELVEAALEKVGDNVGESREKTLEVSRLLAVLYWDNGRWTEAEKLQVDVLEQRRKVQGMEHPDTISAAANLAATYREQGRWSEAEKLEVDVLKQRRKILGVEHPHTIGAASNLAATYQEQGRWSEAENLEVDVLKQRRRVLGMDHPDTIRSASCLAATYWNQGRRSEAEKLEVDVLEQRRRILGMEHPDTILAAENLAITYRQQGRWSEAEKMELDVLEQRRRILGVEHPDTIAAAANLAATYRVQGRWSDAEKLEVDVLDQRRRVMGMQHPDTMKAAASLALTCYFQGRWSEAEKLQVEVFKQRKRILGIEHPDTILVASRLALSYRSQGRWSECLALLEPAVRLSAKVLGREHPDTQNFARILATVYEELDRQEEAEETNSLLLS